MRRRSLKSLLVSGFINLKNIKLRNVRPGSGSFISALPSLAMEMQYVGGMDIRVIYGGTISFTFIISKFPQKKNTG